MFDSLVSFSYSVLFDVGSTLKDALVVSLVFSPILCFLIFLFRLLCEAFCALRRWICDHS